MLTVLYSHYFALDLEAHQKIQPFGNRTWDGLYKFKPNTKWNKTHREFLAIEKRNEKENVEWESKDFESDGSQPEFTIPKKVTVKLPNNWTILSINKSHEDKVPLKFWTPKPSGNGKTRKYKYSNKDPAKVHKYKSKLTKVLRS